jgi:predicted dehydrogenase
VQKLDGHPCDHEQKRVPGEQFSVPKPSNEPQNLTCHGGVVTIRLSVLPVSHFSSDQPLKFAIIGCGLIGRKRISALAKMADASVRFACDLDAHRAAEAAQLVPGCATSTDFRSVVKDSQVEVVVVATLNGALASAALAAVQAGKHVLIEKPGALNAAQLRVIQAAAQRTGSRVRIGYNHRFHPALQKARELVDLGELGPLMFLRARYGHGGRKGYDREWRADPAKSGGGELIDQGVHLIDLAGWFLGELPQVEGHASTLYWDMKVDDNAFVALRTAKGQTAWLHASCTEWKNMFSLEIYGRSAKIAIDGLGGSYGLERLAFYRMLPEMGPPETTIWEYPRGDDSWALEMQTFITDIRMGRDPEPGLVEGIRTLEIVEQIYRNSGFPVSDAGL